MMDSDLVPERKIIFHLATFIYFTFLIVKIYTKTLTQNSTRDYVQDKKVHANLNFLI